MLLALAFIGFALLYASKRITRPLEKLAGAVGELSAGNLDAPAVEARTRDEIGDLARAFNQMVKDLKRHVAALTGATRAREAVESELRVARNIQNALLPRTFPPFPHLPQFELHAVNSPARHIAGDFFDFFFVEDDVLVIVMADVSGKGVPAAMFMAVARTIIRNLAPTCPSPGLLLNRANTLLLQDNTESMFVTMFICRYNIKTGRMVYANAGHPKPLVLSSDGEPREFGEITGTVVGALPDLVFTEAAAELKVGERIVMFTDGITEARAPDQHFFRIDGLIELLTRLNHEPVDRLCIRTMQAVTDFQAGEIIDDITILALQRKE